MPQYRVLVVDDDRSFHELLCAQLAYDHLSLQITAIADSAAALAAHTSQPFDLIVTDDQMPQVDGLGLVRQIRAQHDETPIIFISTHPHVGPVALWAGVNGVLAKPFALPQLVAMIDVLMHEGG